MSPASYLTAPPRGAGGMIPRLRRYDGLVPWWTWVAFGLFLLVGLAAAIGSAVLALRTYRRLRASQKRLTAAMEQLASQLEALEQRADRVNIRTAEVERRFEAARRSAQKLGVLKWALADGAGAVTRLRRALPRK